MTTRKSTSTGSSRQSNRGGNRSSSRGSQIDYWRIAGGIAGVAVTAFLLLTMFGGRRGLTDKARELLDWESEGHTAGGDFSEPLKGERGDREGMTGLSSH